MDGCLWRTWEVLSVSILPYLSFSFRFLKSIVNARLFNPPQLLVRVLINTLYWNFNGFDQAGHYSVSVPKKAFKRGSIISLFLCSSAYLIPILVVTGATDIAQSDWKAGTFAVAGTEIAGKWLGTWIVISSAISVIASFNSELAAGETYF